jgi:Ca2+-binding EF-hand superfamily protein
MEDQEAASFEQHIKQMFDDFDKDKDGSIDRSELELALRSLNLDFTQGDIEAYMEQVDKSKNGAISYEEFKVFFEEKLSYKEQEQLGEIFDLLDRNGDHMVGDLEVQFALHCLGEEISKEEAELMVRVVTSGGKISYICRVNTAKSLFPCLD